MDVTLPVDVVAVLQQLQSSGYEAYVVGGAVRDLFLQKELPTDWDFTTNATPSQIQALFPDSFYENEFGTVGIDRNHIREQFGLPDLEQKDTTQAESYSQVINTDEATKIHESLSKKEIPAFAGITAASKHVFEITTFRSDGSYSDYRRPDKVIWGQTLEEDLHRRDFTINAMAIAVDFDDFTFDISKEVCELSAEAVQFIDPHHGKHDLEKKVIRTVGIAHDRFQEDALRMLRAIRIAVQLHFTIDTDTYKAIRRNAGLIQHVSWERIRDEFMKMLASDQPTESIVLLDETRLLEHILPELIACKKVEQGGHHTTDVWTHALDALRTCPSRDPVVRLATLLHDIAKPQTFNRTKTTITFYNHEVIGARVAKKIADRLRLSKKDAQRMFILVRHHMFHYQPTMTDAALRRFMRKVGLENINDILDLRIGDRLGSGSKETSWRLEEMKQRMLSQLHQPFSIKDLKINGTELMTELNLKPGPILGEILQHLFELVLENPELNEKQQLLEASIQYIKTYD